MQLWQRCTSTEVEGRKAGEGTGSQEASESTISTTSFTPWLLQAFDIYQLPLCSATLTSWSVAAVLKQLQGWPGVLEISSTSQSPQDSLQPASPCLYLDGLRLTHTET